VKVLLAGFNVDREVLEELNRDRNITLTPETLSAAYARISRSPKPVDELRKIAREEIDSARKSNKRIIFKMGHHSIAEHSVFNFDIIGVSRLIVEEIERFRLCSYTEKSQRYITLSGDFVIPQEIKATPLLKPFIETVRIQNNFYRKLYERLKVHFSRKYPHFSRKRIEGRAKEDARYTVCLATQSQLGMTTNARNLELMLRRFASHPLSEVKELGERLFQLVERVTPSIILFYKANDYDKKTYPEMKRFIQEIVKPEKEKGHSDVELVGYTKDGDEILLASLIHRTTQLPFKECFKRVLGLSPEKKRELLKSSFRYMEFYDAVLREFEHINLSYDIVVSASCFAQLKRHRMATITSQEYNPSLGITIPESIKEIGMDKDFKEVMERSEELYFKIYQENPYTAPYILTNAHRKRVLLTVNARELYHISRLREDRSAQWEIRKLANRLTQLAQEVMPLTFLLIGGKDRYPEVYKRVFGKPPKAIPIQEG